jgi:hypothetical protein
MTTTMFNPQAITPWIIPLVLAGCAAEDGYAELNLVDVTGQVTLDGNPLPDARVVFESEEGGGSEAVTDAAGKFRLMYDSEHPGCTPGPKTVQITLAGASEEGADPDAAAGGPAEGESTVETIPAIYNRDSGLKADVSASQREFEFDLKSQP